MNYLDSAYFINSDHPDVVAYTLDSVGGLSDPIEQVIQLYYAVRDGFKYNPYEVVLRPEAMQASYLLGKNSGYCTEKAILLAAGARVLGVPSRLTFADVRNHIGTEKLQEHLKTDVMVFHGATELFMHGKWVKATPAFNLELCQKLGVDALEFDGLEDSVFQSFDPNRGLFMEYVTDHGHFPDMPFDLFVAALQQHYPHLFETAGQQTFSLPD